MEKLQRIEIAEASLERHLGWIAAANERTGTALTLGTAMLGVLAALCPSQASQWTIWQVMFALASAIGLALSLFFCSLAVFPRTKPPHDSLVFFGTVATRTSQQLISEVSAVTEEEYLEDLVAQCHINASIAATKFRWVQRAMLALFVSLAPWVIALFLLYGAPKP